METELKPWERRPGETQRAYAAFRLWLEMDAVRGRSQLETYRQFTGNSEARTYPGYFRQWIEKHRWVERARHYDQHINRETERTKTVARIERQKVWEARREQVADEGWELAEGLIAKAKEILRTPTFEQTVTRENVAPDGRSVIQEITVKPGRFSIRDAARMIQVADQLRRLSAEMATEIIETVTPESQAAAKLKRARDAFEESRDFYPDFTDQERATVIAQAFGVSADDLIDEVAVTSSDAIQ